MLKKSLNILVVFSLLVASIFCFINTDNVYAKTSANCGPKILGIRPWYAGLELGDSCEIMWPNNNSAADPSGVKAGKDLTKIVWVIILNVVAMIGGIVGYACFAFIVYGGFLYIVSIGNPGKVEKGKKTVERAIIGLIISILASTIASVIVDVVIGAVK